MKDNPHLIIYLLGFTLVVCILTIVFILLIRSPVTISGDLLGAIIGYLFADLKIVLAYFFYRNSSQEPPEDKG